jgi:hypothetical protein
MRLNLCSPLEYENAPGLDPFACPPPADEDMPTSGETAASGEAVELLFCFEIGREQVGRIDPLADHFLGEVVFSGKGKAPGSREGGQQKFQLPAGLYLFAQQRKRLDRDECITMAIEQQKDGLWERLRLGNRLYIRRLFEDGSPVTQLFRPYS